MKARLFYSYLGAWDEGEKRHALHVMDELSVVQGCRLERAVPQTLFDGWEFYIDCATQPDLPDYINYQAL
jgi:hypothetical protein